jgi:hypothetical protein
MAQATELARRRRLSRAPEAMNRKRREKLIRQYAAGEITWSALRELGFDSYVHVLGELGKLKLRPPVAPMEGPNVEIRERGRALLRQALERNKPRR